MNAGSSVGFASVDALSTGAAAATSAGTNSGSGNNERDETSAADAAVALSTKAGSIGVSLAGAASTVASGAAAAASGAAGASTDFGLRSIRYPSERKIEAKSSPDAPVRDVIAPLTRKLRPSKKPSGFGPGAPSRHDSAGLMRSARRSRISTRTARSPQMR